MKSVKRRIPGEDFSVFLDQFNKAKGNVIVIKACGKKAVEAAEKFRPSIVGGFKLHLFKRGPHKGLLCLRSR